MVASTPACLTEEWQPALHWRATARLVNGDRSGFDEDVDALELRAQRNGNRALEFQAISWRVSQALLDGRFDAADKLITIARGGVAAYNYFRWFKFLRKLIQLRWDQGRVDEVERLARSGLERSPRFPVLHTMLGLARFHQGDREGAWPAHETVMARLADVPVYLRPEVFVRAAELAVEVGDCNAAARVEAALRPFAGLMVPSHDEALPGSADRYLGMLAAVLGRCGEAATRFEAALSLETRLAAPSHLARTQYWYARSIADDPDGDRRRAAALAAEAAASAERLGMALLAHEAKAVHARVSASPVPEISPV
jgi:hypothetical protein